MLCRYPHCNDLTVWREARVLASAGLGSGLLAACTAKMVMCWFPSRERAMAMGIKQAAFNVGGVVAAMALPSLAIAVGWRYGVRIVALVCFATAVQLMGSISGPPLFGLIATVREEKRVV